MKTNTEKAKTSSLYEEVIQDVAAYKQAALEEAKKSVISNLIPVLEKEIERSLNEEFLKEADNDGLNLDAPPAPSTDLPPSPTDPATTTPPLPADPTMAAPEAPLPATPPATPNVPAMPPALTTPPTGAPIAPPAGSVLGQVPLPGPDGMITVNLSALYNSTSPENPTVDLTGGPALAGAPEGASTDQVDPATNLGGFPTDGDMTPEESLPTPTENPFGESYNFASFKESMDELEARVGMLSEIKQPTTLQNKFLQTFSGLKFLTTKGAVSAKISSLYENKLETLYSELEENINTYNSIQENQGNKMSRVTRELLKILSENSEAKGHAGFGDGESAPKGKTELDPGNASGKHAMKTSDSDPKDPGKQDSLKTGAAAGYLEEEAEALELEAALKEMFGDEDAGSEPMEEAAEVVGDKVSAKMPAVKPGKAVNTNTVAVMEAKKKIKEKLKNLKKESAQLAKAIQECNQSMMADEAPVMGDSSVVDTGKGVTVTINISGPGIDGASVGDGMDAVHSEPDGDEDFDFGGVSDGDEDDDSSFEITDDDDDSSSDLPVDSDESSSDDDDDDDSVPPMGESALKKENARLKESVAEMQLLAARSLYLNKLMALEGVSVSQKRKMAGYMDNVKTIAEAKETYFKIKEVLDENLATRKASTVRGSSSSATTKPSSSLVKESKETAEGSTESNPIRDRWMILAGITK